MIIINYKDRIPIYEQIAEQYKQLILTGILENESKMPSIRSLAMELSVNPNTIQKAYAKLEQEGFIYALQGRGNYVADTERLLMHKKQEIQKKFHDILREIMEVYNFDKKELIDWTSMILEEIL